MPDGVLSRQGAWEAQPSLSVIVCNCFEGFHAWAEAPEEVAFLRSRHRHLFTVQTTIHTDHHNRAVEFFLLQRRIEQVIALLRGRESDYEQWSCERWATMIGEQLRHEALPVTRVEVWEDNENAGVAQW